MKDLKKIREAVETIRAELQFESTNVGYSPSRERGKELINFLTVVHDLSAELADTSDRDELKVRVETYETELKILRLLFSKRWEIKRRYS